MLKVNDLKPGAMYDFVVHPGYNGDRPILVRVLYRRLFWTMNEPRENWEFRVLIQTPSNGNKFWRVFKDQQMVHFTERPEFPVLPDEALPYFDHKKKIRATANTAGWDG